MTFNCPTHDKKDLYLFSRKLGVFCALANLKGSCRENCPSRCKFLKLNPRMHRTRYIIINTWNPSMWFHDHNYKQNILKTCFIVLLSYLRSKSPSSEDFSFCYCFSLAFHLLFFCPFFPIFFPSCFKRSFAVRS